MPVVLSAAGLLVLLEIIGALASRPLGYPYPTLGAVSILIYATVGLLGSLRAGFLPGVLGAGLAGLLDGSLGPLGAWLVGPGPLSVTIDAPRGLCLPYRGSDCHRSGGRRGRCPGWSVGGAAPGIPQRPRSSLPLTLAKPFGPISLTRPMKIFCMPSGVSCESSAD
jgi:hypothetical protein